MKSLTKLSALAVIALGSASLALADTVTIASYATGAAAPDGAINTNMFYAYGASTINNGSNTTYNVNPTVPNTWTPPIGNSSYVSLNPGDGPGGHNVEPNGLYTYNTYFTLSPGTYTGTFDVLADDTVTVVFNNTVVLTAAQNASYQHCSSKQPNCTIPTTVTLDSSLFNTAPGSLNELEFQVSQVALHQTGVDFEGTISAAAPEPSTLLLLGTGLMGSAGALFRRMRS